MVQLLSPCFSLSLYFASQAQVVFPQLLELVHQMLLATFHFFDTVMHHIDCAVLPIACFLLPLRAGRGENVATIL